ncbi:MAG TPA: hypothetical protein VF590_24875 [Isosphaeraceae bacterium]|jgi:hypothetical protein
MTDHKARMAALAACFDAESAADIEMVILGRHAGRALTLHGMVQELRDAGLSTQADELLKRINSLTPQGSPALPGPAQSRPSSPQTHSPQSNVPAVNGVINGVASGPLAPRRGRPPKSQNNGGPQS